MIPDHNNLAVGLQKFFLPFPSVFFKGERLDFTNFLWRQYLGPETVGR